MLLKLPNKATAATLGARAISISPVGGSGSNDFPHPHPYFRDVFDAMRHKNPSAKSGERNLRSKPYGKSNFMPYDTITET